MDYSPSRGSGLYQTQLSAPKYTREQPRDERLRAEMRWQTRNANRSLSQRAPEQKPESQNNPTKTHTLPTPCLASSNLEAQRSHSHPWHVHCTGAGQDQRSFAHLAPGGAQWTQTLQSAATWDAENSNKPQKCCFCLSALRASRCLQTSLPLRSQLMPSDSCTERSQPSLPVRGAFILPLLGAP